MPTFAENFLRAYAVGTESKARQERLRLEEEQQALQRQMAITQMQRIDEDRKVQAVQRQQQDVLDQLRLMERVDRPTIPAGDGVGPPAPAEIQPLQFPLHGGGKMPITPLFRGDILEAERAKKEMANDEQLDFEVRKATALGPIQAELERAKGSITLPPGLGKPLGLPEGVALPKEVVNTAEVIFQQREINRRQARELENSKTEAPTEQYLAHLLDAAQHRNLDLQRLGVKTYNALQQYAAAKGEKIPRQFSDRERKNADLAVNGLGAVLDMERLYKADPNVIKAAAFPTALGRKAGEVVFQTPHAEEFEAARKRAMDPEMRAATGAALNEQEQRFYNELQATLFNDPEAVQFKFNHLKSLYAVSTGTPFSVKMPDGKVFKVTDSADIAQRIRVKRAIELGGEPIF